jgi:hypothetical protein
MGAMTLQQVHGKFKIFTGTLAADKTLGALGREVAAFVRDNNVAAKSIGVEYLESAKKLILTLGYRDDEATYPIALRSVPLGKIEGLNTDDMSRLEAAMEAAAADITNLLCHELYITEEGDFLMVTMSRD